MLSSPLLLYIIIKHDCSYTGACHSTVRLPYVFAKHASHQRLHVVCQSSFSYSMCFPGKENHLENYFWLYKDERLILEMMVPYCFHIHSCTVKTYFILSVRFILNISMDIYKLTMFSVL